MPIQVFVFACQKWFRLRRDIGRARLLKFAVISAIWGRLTTLRYKLERTEVHGLPPRHVFEAFTDGEARADVPTLAAAFPGCSVPGLLYLSALLLRLSK